MMVSLGKQIHIMRTVRGIKQGELARLIKKRQPTLSEFETDKLRPSEKTLQTIKAVLSWPSDDQAKIAFAILANDGDRQERFDE